MTDIEEMRWLHEQLEEERAQEREGVDRLYFTNPYANANQDSNPYRSIGLVLKEIRQAGEQVFHTYGFLQPAYPFL